MIISNKLPAAKAEYLKKISQCRRYAENAAIINDFLHTKPIPKMENTFPRQAHENRVIRSL